MCIIASADNTATEQCEWVDEEWVDTANLQIPPDISIEYGTPVYTMNQRAPEWEL